MTMHKGESRFQTAGLVALLLVVALVGGCGGASNSSPTTPTLPTVLPSGTTACGVISGQTSSALAIVNGTTCAGATASVPMLYLVGSDGFLIGFCSGTVISPTAILTAAHCLSSDVTTVRATFGGLKEFTATSFKASPNYNGTASNSIDVGVVLFGAQFGQPVMPLLSSRDAAVGEPAVIAGYGQDLFGESRILRAGATTISVVGSVYLQNDYGGSSASTCSGDSGGPMLVSVNGTWAVAGVTSSVSGSCVAGSNYYVNMRNSLARSFVLGLVPDATLK
jgi:hypothetical protein